MLVLSGRIDERIYIGEQAEICVTIVGIHSGKVRLGFEVPAGMPVQREHIAREMLHLYGRMVVPNSTAEILKQRGRQDG